MKHEVFLLTGSNQGQREDKLAQCIEALQQQVGTIVKASSVYETEAWGLQGLPPHLNQALLLHTTLSANELLDVIHHIEHDLGRVREQKWGIRTIDIDIIYFDQQIINTPHLVIPHPLMQERRFVLTPLVEIAPEYRHPVLQMTNNELLAVCSDALAVNAVSYIWPSNHDS